MPLRRPLAAPFTLFICMALLALACGSGDAADNGDDDGGSAATPTPALDVISSPVLAMPASRFALSLEDLPDGYLTDGESTFHLTTYNYGATTIFPNAEEGRNMLESWGYLGGYETAFEPEQQMTAVLNGGYYAAVEVHLFGDDSGASTAQHYFEEQLSGASERVSAAQIGNESSAWTLTHGKIPGSNIRATYHQVVFRRGTMVGVVQTYGSEAFMSIETAHALAKYVDEKALGTRPAVEPTPLSVGATSTPEQ